MKSLNLYLAINHLTKTTNYGKVVLWHTTWKAVVLQGVSLGKQAVRFLTVLKPFVTRRCFVIDFYRSLVILCVFWTRGFKKICKKILMGTWGLEIVILCLPPPHNFLCLLLFTIAGNLLPVTSLGIMEHSKWTDIVEFTYDLNKENTENSKICSCSAMSSLWYRTWKMKKSELKVLLGILGASQVNWWITLQLYTSYLTWLLVIFVTSSC